MKKNRLIIILVIIIAIIGMFVVYNNIKDNNKENKDNNKSETNVSLKETIALSYANIYLLSNGDSYIIPLVDEEVDRLEIDNSLKNRLKNIYTKSFYYDVYVNNNKLKGYKVNLDDKVSSIKSMEINDNTYIIFIKENHTIGLFDYMDYCNSENTKVLDNYKNIENVLNLDGNKIIYLDGNSEELIIEE